MERSDWALGKLLADAREGLGESQTSAAKRAGLSKTVWQQLESGLRRDTTTGEQRPFKPRVDTVTSAARAVSVNLRLALELAGLNPDAADSPVQPSEAQRLHIERWQQLSEPQKAALEALIMTMLDPGASPYDTFASSTSRNSTVNGSDPMTTSADASG